MNRRSSSNAQPCLSAERVREFLADHLAEDEESAVASHVESCADCRRIIEQQAALQRWVHAPLPAYQVPQALLERMYALADATTEEGLTDTLGGLPAWGEPEDPRQVGRFTIERRLGMGGFGVVLLAHDPILKRRVALKLPRLPRVLDAAQHARFQREARAAARLHHTSIVPVYEAGEADGLHYLATDFCPGPNLANWLAEQPSPLAPKQAATIIAMLADAVEHAHQQGVLHRDIKPGNVLLDPRTPSRGLPFTPKLTDFGLAKLLHHEVDATLSGQLIGTPRYMSPEQATGQRDRIDPRSDVYALGVILYELLTLNSPIAGADNADTLRRVLTDQPVRPRSWNAQVPRDLEAICLRCLEKRAEQRYTSAGELAADLQRYLDGRPTVARPVSLLRRALKQARRRPALTAGALLMLIVLLASGVSGMWFWRIHRDQRQKIAASQVHDREQDAEIERRGKERDRVQKLHAYTTGIRQAALAMHNGRGNTIDEVLNNLSPVAGQEDLREFSWRYLQRGITLMPTHPQNFHAVAYGNDRIVAAGVDVVYAWSTDDAHRLLQITRLNKRSKGQMWLSRDGQRLVSSSPSEERPTRIYYWNTDSGELVRELALDWDFVQAAISPDGRQVAIAGGLPHKVARVLLWDPRTNRTEAILEQPAQLDPLASQGKATAVCFSRDGKRLATAFHENDGGTPPLNWTCLVLDIATRAEVARLKVSRSAISGIAFSPAGDRLVACGSDGSVMVWELTHGQRTLGFSVPEPCLPVADFSCDGTLLATGLFPLFAAPGGTELIDVRNVRTGERQYLGLPDTRINGVTFAPHGPSLAMACLDGVRVADLSGQHSPTVLSAHAPAEAWGMAFSPDGKTFATSGDDHLARLWDSSAVEQRKLDAGALPLKVAFAPKGGLLSTAGYDGVIRFWNQETGEEIRQLRGHQGPVRSIAFCPRGRWLASAGHDGAVKLWDLEKQALTRTLRRSGATVYSVVFAPDGSELFSAGSDGIVSVWNHESGELLRSFEETVSIFALAHAPVARILAIGTRHPEIELRRADTEELVFRLAGHTAGVKCLAFSPDGKTLASGSQDRSVRLWHVATGEELLAFTGLPGQVNEVAFSADGLTLGAACHDGSVRLWKAKR